ncbi:MAG: succinate dehydrogenase, hydrophobic membrane anchor protein [bacterium]
MSRQASGLQAWFLQRLSAVYLLLFVVYFFTSLLVHGDFILYEWQEWFAHPVMTIATWLFFVALLLHAWIGIRDVVIDYIHPPAIRLLFLSLLMLLLTGCGVWMSFVLITASAF